MKNAFCSILALIFICSCTFADSESVDSVVTVNASDIRSGDVSLKGRQTVSSGQPDSAVLEMISAAGFAAVVDLRGVAEKRGIDEASEVAALGMRYINLPISGAADVSYENARILEEILDEIDGPVLVHCASGNRVGALFALKAKLAGSSVDEAMALGKAAGLTRLEPVVAERLRDK